MRLIGVIDSNKYSLLKGYWAKYINVQNVSKPFYPLVSFLEDYFKEIIQKERKTIMCKAIDSRFIILKYEK